MDILACEYCGKTIDLGLCPIRSHDHLVGIIFVCTTCVSSIHRIEINTIRKYKPQSSKDSEATNE